MSSALGVDAADKITAAGSIAPAVQHSLVSSFGFCGIAGLECLGQRGEVRCQGLAAVVAEPTPFADDSPFPEQELLNT